LEVARNLERSVLHRHRGENRERQLADCVANASRVRRRLTREVACGIESLVLAGIATSGVVLSTVRHAEAAVEASTKLSYELIS
jgi:nicotinamidase-related amidase